MFERTTATEHRGGKLLVILWVHKFNDLLKQVIMAAVIKPIDVRSIHLIQSGQVIVDLCSVAKELVENSIDSGANVIDVRFKNQGLDLVEIQDNGCGISPANYSFIALKHYTSKLSSYSDISSLQTFGFRGEALASLCALSTLTLTTCLESDVPKGSKLTFAASGKLINREVVAAPRGTIVTVEKLFHNLPVRRRELERNIKREWHKVIALLNQYACIQTNVKFSVSQQPTKGKRILLFSTKGNATTRENIINVFGSKAISALLSLDLLLELRPSEAAADSQTNEKRNASLRQVHICGHVSRPINGDGRQTPDRQMFFVNGRPCGLPQFVKVFNEVYKSYNVSQSPFIFVNIKLDPNMYDVNVSPDKRSILLHDQGLLLNTLRSSLVELFDTQDHRIPTTQISAPQPLSCTQSSAPSIAHGSSLLAVEQESAAISRGGLISMPESEKEDAVSCHPDEDEMPNLHLSREARASSDKKPGIANQNFLSKWLHPDSELAESSLCLNRHTNEHSQPRSMASDSQLKWKRTNSDSTPEPLADHRMHTDETTPSVHTGVMRGRRVLATQNDEPLKSSSALGNSQSQSLPGKKLAEPEGLDNGIPLVSSDTLNTLFVPSLEHRMLSEYEENTDGAKSPILTSGIQKTGQGISIEDSSTIQTPSLGENPDKIDDKGLGVRKKFATCHLMQVVRSTGKALGSISIPCRRYSQQEATSEVESTVADIHSADAESRLSLIIARDDFVKMRVVGQFNLGFIIAILPKYRDVIEHDELLIIDQHASDEKFNFEKLQKNTTVQSQRLVHPKILALTALEEEIVLENLEALEANGFKVQVDSTGDAPVGSRCKLLALPLSRETTFSLQDLEELISLLADTPVGSAHVPRPTRVRKMFAMRACRSSIMIGKALSVDQMYVLLRHMGELDKPWNCPHGRPTMRHLCRLQAWDGARWTADLPGNYSSIASWFTYTHTTNG